MTLEQDLIKAGLYLERLKPKSLSILLDNLDTAKDNIISQISNTNNQLKIRQIIKSEVTNALKDMDSLVLNDIEDITGLTWNSTGAILTAYLAKDITKKFIKFDNLDDIIKKQLLNPKRSVFGHNLDQHKTMNIYTYSNKLIGIVNDGIERKVGINEISLQIERTLGVVKSQTSTLARSSVMSAINEAKNIQYAQMLDGVEDVIYYYNSIMDSRTSKRCWTLHGFSSSRISDIYRLLNFHWNCRAMLGVTTKRIIEYQRKHPELKSIRQWDSKLIRHRDGTNSSKFTVNSVKYVKPQASAETYFNALDDKFKKQYAGKKRYEDYKNKKIDFETMMGTSRKELITKDVLKRDLGLI